MPQRPLRAPIPLAAKLARSAEVGGVELAGRVGLVTGGGRGIGRASALALAGAGMDVAVAARSVDELELVAGEVRLLGRRALAVRCDVTSFEQCQAAVEQTVAELGRLDLLVANAGGEHERTSVEASDPTAWAGTLAVNLAGVYYSIKAALPALIAAGGGKILVVGSGLGHQPRPGNSAYSVAKAGAWMLVRCLAQEVWEYGIDVNEVVPGPVLTRLTQEVFNPNRPAPFAPSERVKQPQEVGELVRWLAGQPPGGPTGQTFSLARRPID